MIVFDLNAQIDCRLSREHPWSLHCAGYFSVVVPHARLRTRLAWVDIAFNLWNNPMRGGRHSFVNSTLACRCTELFLRCSLSKYYRARTQSGSQFGKDPEVRTYFQSRFWEPTLYIEDDGPAFFDERHSVPLRYTLVIRYGL